MICRVIFLNAAALRADSCCNDDERKKLDDSGEKCVEDEGTRDEQGGRGTRNPSLVSIISSFIYRQGHDTVVSSPLLFSIISTLFE